jgi:3-phenylpropionate/trans-cinnamate dioxygenase alpha subunit
MCTYHGWTYDLQGRLVGVPGFKEVYHEELDRESWGLIRAPHVDTYKGFIFASLDAEAPSLLEYLGDVGQIGVSMMAERGENVAILGGVQKYTVNCNWKFAVDNVFDYYHVELTHSSALMTREVKRPSLMGAPQRAILGHYGHAIGGPAYNVASGSMPWRNRPEAQSALGPVGMGSNGHPHIFPNTWIATTTNQIIVRHPKGPARTEVWLYTVLDREMPVENYAQQRNYAIHIHGPAGSFEMEDGENWDQSTAGMKGSSSRRSPLHYGLNLGHGEVVRDETGPAYIDSKFAEHPQLWVWKSWCYWMSTSTWEELREATSTPPSVM